MEIADDNGGWMDLAERTVANYGVRAAFTELELAAARGFSSAWATIGMWRLTGQYIRRDLSLAQAAFKEAAKLGNKGASKAYIALLAGGPGNSDRDWPEVLRLLKDDSDEQEQLNIISGMSLDQYGESLHEPEPKSLHPNANIFCVAGFLSLSACTYIRNCAAPFLRPSVTVDPRTGNLVPHPVRTSQSAAFSLIEETPALHAINRRIARMTQTHVNQGEPGQVLWYQKGEEYKPHLDALLPPHDQNQRCLTVLIYLNDQYTGGETHFPNLGINFRGGIGDAILFANVDQIGKIERSMVHTSRPVLSGEKYVYSRWIRSESIDLAGPAGKPF